MQIWSISYTSVKKDKFCINNIPVFSLTQLVAIWLHRLAYSVWWPWSEVSPIDIPWCHSKNLNSCQSSNTPPQLPYRDRKWSHIAVCPCMSDIISIKAACIWRYNQHMYMITCDFYAEYYIYLTLEMNYIVLFKIILATPSTITCTYPIQYTVADMITFPILRDESLSLSYNRHIACPV